MSSPPLFYWSLLTYIWGRAASRNEALWDVQKVHAVCGGGTFNPGILVLICFNLKLLQLIELGLTFHKMYTGSQLMV